VENFSYGRAKLKETEMRLFLTSILLALALSSGAAAQTCPTPSQLATDLAAASQDDVVDLAGVNPLNCPEVSMAQTWTGGKLIFSDSPEKPSDRGKLYEDATLGYTSGTVYNRVFAYHVNGNSKKRLKIAILLKNLGDATGELKVQKSGTAGPTTAYLYAGKLAFLRWLESSAGSAVNVSPGSTVQLTTAISTSLAYNYLMTGIYDYSFDKAHQLTVCVLRDTDVPLSVCPGLSVLSRDGHQRGTFPNADKVYDSATGVQIDTADGIAQLPLAAGTTNDAWTVGVDATDGSSQTLTGNYGILYKVHLNTKSSDSRKLGFLVNPRGGTWGGAIWPVPGLTPGGRFLIPAGSSSLGDNSKGALAGKYEPGSSFTFWMQFMPTGGSSLPLRFVAVPH
jgi:hypothetical protein